MKGKSPQSPWRIWTAFVVLLGYLVGALGLLPSPGTIGVWLTQLTGGVWRGGERYPCEADACGCGSAQECWATCGCQTRVAKLAWALASGVMPPAGVQFTDDEWLASANLVQSGSAECELCIDPLRDQLRRGVALRAGKETLDTPGSCSQGSCPGNTTSRGRDATARSCCATGEAGETAAPGVTLTIRAKSCKGLTELLSVGLVPPLMQGAAAPMLFGALLGARAVPSDQRAVSRELETAVPPPRRAA